MSWFFSEFFSQPSSSGGQHREVPPGTRIQPAAPFSCLLLVQPVFHLNALLYFFCFISSARQPAGRPREQKTTNNLFQTKKKGPLVSDRHEPPLPAAM